MLDEIEAAALRDAVERSPEQALYRRIRAGGRCFGGITS